MLISSEWKEVGENNLVLFDIVEEWEVLHLTGCLLDWLDI